MGRMVFPEDFTGGMVFPGEKIRDYLPPRENSEDMVGLFGAWLTQKGAWYVMYVVGGVLMFLGGSKLLIMLISAFQGGFWSAVWGVICVTFLGWIGFYAIGFILWAVFGMVWVLGWICYNKWTLITFLSTVPLLYFFVKFDFGG